MKTRNLVGLILLLSGTVVYASEAQPRGRSRTGSATAMRPAPAAQAATVKLSSLPDGDDAYKANCSRCHLAPRKFSDRQTATIMMHMRARANMTAAETEAILQYLVQ